MYTKTECRTHITCVLRETRKYTRRAYCRKQNGAQGKQLDLHMFMNVRLLVGVLKLLEK